MLVFLLVSVAVIVLTAATPEEWEKIKREIKE